MNRRVLPNRRRNETISATVGGTKVYVTLSRFADGRVAEVFLKANKAGSGVQGFAQSLAIAVSIGLQHGATVAEYANALRGVSFEPDGIVDGYPGIAEAKSIIDFFVRALEQEDAPALPAPTENNS